MCVYINMGSNVCFNHMGPNVLVQYTNVGSNSVYSSTGN